MGSPSLIAKLGLDEADFARGLKASEAGLAQTQEKAKLLAAEVALLEQRMASGKTDAMGQQHKALQSTLRETRAEARAMAQQLAALEAVKPAAAKSPDDSARYAAHLAKQEEAERSARAQEAIANTRLAMPMASRPVAVVRMEQRQPGEEEAKSGHGSNAMRNAELMHSGRAMADMLAAGMSPVQALMMEGPRLFQAFAGSLGALLVPITALVAGGGFVAWLHNADTQAKALRAETAGIASNLGSIGGADASQLEKAMESAAQQIAKVREAYDSKGNWFVNHLTGGGVHESDVAAAQEQQRRIQDRMQDAQARDQGFERRKFDGDEGVEADRIRLEYAKQRDEIVKKASEDELQGSTRALELAEEERDVKLDELARTQQARRNELAEETQLASIRRYGKNVESENARAHLEKAQADLRNGPQSGPDFERNQAAVWNAETGQRDAQHHERESDADQDLRARNANLRGVASDVEFQRAVNSRDTIQGKLDDKDTTPDEKKKLTADLAEANAEIARQKRASAERGVAFEKSQIQAQTGRGPDEEVHAIDRQMEVIDHQRQVNKDHNGGDPVVAAQLDAEAHDLLKKKEDILFTEQESLKTLQHQGDEIRSHGYELDAQAKKKSIEEKYRPEIDKAEREHDGAKAAQLRGNEADEQFDADVDEEIMTPAQKQARAKHNSDRARAAYRVQNKRDRHSTADRANGSGFEEYFRGANRHTIGAPPLTAPNRIDAIKAGAANAGKGDAPRVDNAGIIGALGKVETAVKDISFKRRG